MRARAIVVALSAASLLGVGTVAPSVTASASSSKVIMFGGNKAFVNQVPTVGRLAIIRTFHTSVAVAFPKPEEAAALKAGSTLLVSAKPLCSTACASGLPGWQDVAAGNQDTAYTNLLNAMQRAAVSYHLPKIYFAFTHEPETASQAAFGTAADFVAAWTHLRQLADQLKASVSTGGRVTFVLVMTQSAYSGSAPKATAYFPGAANVDVLGADVYNWVGCSTNTTGQYDPTKLRTPAQLLAPVENWRAANDSTAPLMLPEWGTVPTSYLPATSGYSRPAWIQSMTTYLGSRGTTYLGSMYWDDPQNKCPFSVDGDAASLQALKQMGSNQAFTRLAEWR